MDKTTSVKNDEYEQKISNGEWAGVIGIRVYNSNRPRLSMFHWRPSTSRKVEPILSPELESSDTRVSVNLYRYHRKSKTYKLESTFPIQYDDTANGFNAITLKFDNPSFGDEIKYKIYLEIYNNSYNPDTVQSDPIYFEENYELTIWMMPIIFLMMIFTVFAMQNVHPAVLYRNLRGQKKGKNRKKGKQSESDYRFTSFLMYMKSLLDKAGITLTKERVFTFIDNNTYLSTEEKQMLNSYKDYSYNQLLAVIKHHNLVDSILALNPRDVIKTILDYSVGIIGSTLKSIYKNTSDFLSYIFGSSQESSFWDMDGLFESSYGTRKSKRKIRYNRKWSNHKSIQRRLPPQ